MRILAMLLLLGLSSGCAMDDFLYGDYDDDYYPGTSPGYQEIAPGGQPAQNPQSPTAPPTQTREPPR